MKPVSTRARQCRFEQLVNAFPIPRVPVAVLACCLVGWCIRADITETWKQTVSVSGAASDPTHLLLDARGRALVLSGNLTSSEREDFTLYAVDPDGSLAWSHRYQAPSLALPGDVAIARDGGIWIAGAVATDGAQGRFFVLTLASDGARRWERHLDPPPPPFPSRDWVVRLVPHGTDGAYVSLRVPGAFHVLRLDAAGAVLWHRELPIAADTVMDRTHAALDPEGALALIASSRSPLQNSLQLLRWGDDGTLQLHRAHDLGHRNAFVTAARVDAQGNIHVAASVPRSSPWDRYHLVVSRYNPAGELVWSRIRPPIVGHHIVSGELEIDPAGGAVVTAHERWPLSDDENAHRSVTVGYTRDGSERWVATSSVDRRPIALSIGTLGDVFVTGIDASRGTSGTFLTRYLPDGTRTEDAILPGRHPIRLARADSDGLYVVVAGDVEGRGFELRRFQHTEVSDPVSVRIEAPSSIAAFGTSLVLTSQVRFPGPLTYQWLHNGYLIQGGNGPALLLADVRFPQDGTYSLQVTSGDRHAVSADARVIVVPRLSLARTPDGLQLRWQPGSGFRLESSASLTVANWVSLPDHADGVLPLPLIDDSQARYFRLVR